MQCVKALTETVSKKPHHLGFAQPGNVSIMSPEYTPQSLVLVL